MLIGLNVRKVQIPHEPEDWVLLRDGISPTQMESMVESRQAQALSAAAPIVAQVGMDAFREIIQGLNEGRTARQIAAQSDSGNTDQESEVQTEVPAKVEEVEFKDPLMDRRLYDLDLGITHLVKDWSYKAPVNVRAVRMLDSETRNWLHDKVMEALPIDSISVTEGNS